MNKIKCSGYTIDITELSGEQLAEVQEMSRQIDRDMHKSFIDGIISAIINHGSCYIPSLRTTLYINPRGELTQLSDDCGFLVGAPSV